MSDVTFEIGEVVSSYNDTYASTTDLDKKPYGIRVKVISDSTSQHHPTRFAIPYDINNLQVPVKGEQVLLVKGFKNTSKNKNYSTQYYYISSFSSNSSSNINSIVSIAEKQIANNILDLKQKSYKEIVEKNISLLQLYPGDRILSGRWGNTIRLGSTTKPNSKLNTISPVLLTDDKITVGDPVIIISNTKEHNEDKQFINENINSDYSSLYLTSTQKLSKFVLNTPITKATSESAFSLSQFVGVADRVILKANSDIIALDSQKSVVINTPELKLGDDEADESMVHGDELATILKELIATIRKPRFGGGLAIGFNRADLNKFDELSKRIEKIKSDKFKLKK